MDCSLPGSSVHGIFQARVLEWGAIAFSRGIVNIVINEEIVLVEGSCTHTSSQDCNKDPLSCVSG